MKILAHGGSGSLAVVSIMRRIGARVVFVSHKSHIPPPDEWTHLLLLGGSDISPSWYGQDVGYARPGKQKRDVTEWYMLRQAMADNKTIMGICRGMQFLSVAHGSYLHQDIRRQRVSSSDHTSSNHFISVTKKLDAIIPSRAVNSRHHQAVAVAPPGMKVIARSPDGIIEAVHKPGVLGVQWHPEDLAEDDPRWDELFIWFLEGLM